MRRVAIEGTERNWRVKIVDSVGGGFCGATKKGADGKEQAELECLHFHFYMGDFCIFAKVNRYDVSSSS